MFALATLAVLKNTGIGALPEKATIIKVRWPLVIFCSYLVLYSPSLPSEKVIGFALFYILSNGALYFAKDELFRFYGPLVLIDTCFLGVSIALSGQAGADFYLACFLTILLCCIVRDLYGILIVAILGPVIYGAFLIQSVQSYDAGVYLRFPFPFVISLFYGYFVQIEQTQKRLKELDEVPPVFWTGC